MTTGRVTPVKLAFNSFEPDGGASDEPPIIFCHGIAFAKEVWGSIPQATADALKRKVYAIDARNHGDSERSDLFTFDANVDDLLHFMDTIGARTASIVGHSMGGVTAIRAALRVPERVASIVVEDMTVRRMSKQVLDMLSMILGLKMSALEQLPLGFDEEEARNMLFQIMCEKLPPALRTLLTKDSMEEHMFRYRRLEDGRLVFRCNMEVLQKALKNQDELQADCSGLYEGPACFIYGTNSPVKVSSDESNIKIFFPGAKLIPIEKGTHNLHGDFRDEFLRAVLDFF